MAQTAPRANAIDGSDVGERTETAPDAGPGPALDLDALRAWDRPAADSASPALDLQRRLVRAVERSDLRHEGPAPWSMRQTVGVVFAASSAFWLTVGAAVLALA